MAANFSLFNLQWYLDTNPDVAEAVRQGLIDAEEHFNQHGKAEGRSPGPLFNLDQYLLNNPDVAAAVARGETTAYDHFMQFGAGEGRSPVNMFDEAFYLSQNPDVAAAVAAGLTSAIEHFLAYGQGEPRAFNPAIDLGAYLAANPDVAAAAAQGLISPLEHLMMHGVSEGRDLGNGVNLGMFGDDPVFQQALASGALDSALDRVSDVAPFIPSFEMPSGWTPPADLPIPTDFVPPEGLKLVIPEGVEVPEGTELPDTFEPATPPVTPPGGGGGGEPPLPYTNAWGLLDAAAVIKAEGGGVEDALYVRYDFPVGNMNPANKFVTSTNTEVGLQLGLDVRYTLDQTEVERDDSSTNSLSVFTVNPGNNVRIAYSVASIVEKDGEGYKALDLDAYDIRLSIDKNPDKNLADFLTYTLVSANDLGPVDPSKPSGFDWSLMDTDLYAPWNRITDDAGDAWVTQNIQSIGWYLGGDSNNESLEPGSGFHIRLEAYSKGTTDLLAFNEILIIVGALEPA